MKIVDEKGKEVDIKKLPDEEIVAQMEKCNKEMEILMKQLSSESPKSGTRDLKPEDCQFE